MSYGDDLDKVRKVLIENLAKDDRILKDPAPTIGVLELADSSVNFAVRPWVKTADYWDVFFAAQESIKKRFDFEGICIPFPPILNFGVFKRLNKYAIFFKQVRVGLDTVEWECGVDLDPEFIYAKCMAQATGLMNRSFK